MAGSDRAIHSNSCEDDDVVKVVPLSDITSLRNAV